MTALGLGMSEVPGFPSGVERVQGVEGFEGFEGQDGALWDGLVSCIFVRKCGFLSSLPYLYPRSHWVGEPQRRPVVRQLYIVLPVSYI